MMDLGDGESRARGCLRVGWMPLLGDLKADDSLKERGARQVQKYMEALERQLREPEAVYPEALLINFPQAGQKKIAAESLELAAPQVLRVGRDHDPAELTTRGRGRNPRLASGR